MKLTESHLRNLIKQELKRFLNISESQDNKPRRYSPQEMEAIEDQIMRDEEEGLPPSGPFPDPKKYPRRTPQEMQAIYDQIITNWEEDDEEEFGITEKIRSQSARSLKEKLARLARK